MNNNRLDSNNKVALVAAFGEDVVKVEGRTLVLAGHRAIAILCDVSDDAQVEQTVDHTVAEFGGLDAVFSNAGVMVRVAPTAESTREEWGRVSGIDLRGVWN